MNERVLGVLGGGETPEAQLRAWVESAQVLYAADSGANRLIQLGFRPIVVGDLDSFDPMLAPGARRIVEDPDPDRTDCDKLLDLARSEGRAAITLIDAEGDMLDHVLATLSSLARSNLDGRVALRTGLAWLVRAGQPTRLPNVAGRRVSLIPLTTCRGVCLSGVEWEVQEADMAPAGFLSVSNRATGPLEARIEEGLAYLFVAIPPQEQPLW